MDQHAYTRPTASRTGRRALPPGLQAQWELAAQTPLPRLPRSKASCAFKRVAAAIGVRGSAFILMDTLIGLAPKTAFERGEPVIVTPSNDWLADTLGVDVRTIQASLARLIALGVIIPRDSANLRRGERHGERYGFDLSPLARRADEFAALAAENKARRELVAHLRRAMTRDRTACLIEIDALGNAELAARYAGRVEALYGSRKGVREPEVLSDLRIGLHRLKEELIGLNSSPLDDEIVIHHDNTSNPPVSYETTDEATPRHAEPPIETPKSRSDGRALRMVADRIGELVPALCAYASGERVTWRDVDTAGEALADHIGLRQTAWMRACDELGRQAALAIMIVVLAKRERGLTWKPAGLFVRMCQLAGKGELRLERTLFGLASNLPPLEYTA